MTEALEKAVTKARSLPAEEQDRLAEIIEQEYEQVEWRRLVERPESLALLDQLAEQARKRERAGQTTSLEDLF
ncbi:MAG TPA: hypothetical protein VGW38_13985 [Chloroflexota bacterium]|nr:hypothetical protein [Chloroflexota bacterium]